MKRVPATEKTHRPVTPPHLCIVFFSSSSRPAYRNFKKDICRKAEPCLPSFRLSRVCARLPRSVSGFLACAHGFPEAFSAFSRVRIASPARFRLSRVCALLPRSIFGFLALAHCFPGAFSGFSRVRIASPARFWLSRACARLPRRVFGFLACAHGFPGAFSAFSHVRTASPARFRALRGGGRGKTLSIRFGQTSSYSKEFLWQKLKN